MGALLIFGALRAIATLLVLVTLGMLAGKLARRYGQPAVVGELLAGITLGPTVLGHVPWLADWATPTDGPTSAIVGMAAKAGLVLFVLGAGAEVGGNDVRSERRVILPVSALGFVLPLVAGTAFGLATFAAGAASHAQAWFLGIALSVSALPVIARTLSDLALLKTPFGAAVIGSVVVTDLLAWAGLAVVVLTSVAGATGDSVGRLVADMVLVVFFIGLLLPARAKHWLVGEDAPRWRTHARTVGAVLYFTTAGLRIDLGASLELFFSCSVLAIAVTTKTLGSYVGARIAGLSQRTAAGIGAAMNARGAMEIVIATTGIQLGLADARTYGTLVVLAIASSVATAPILRALRPDPALGRTDTTENDTLRVAT
jgi:Kef-type K+ transport system membrane component KefB